MTPENKAVQAVITNKEYIKFQRNLVVSSTVSIVMNKKNSTF